MSLPPGGVADKLGNRYEHWWTAIRLLDVLEGTATRIRIEPPGDDGLGVEFQIEESDGLSAEQVKAAGADGNWTLGRLQREGLLTAAKAHILSGKRFRLVATTPAPALETLSDRARRSESLQEFLEYLPKDSLADFGNLTEHWSLDAESSWKLLLAAVLVVRFMRTGGPAMMKMMNGGPDDMSGHDHSSHGMPNHDQSGHGMSGHDHSAHGPAADQSTTPEHIRHHGSPKPHKDGS